MISSFYVLSCSDRALSASVGSKGTQLKNKIQMKQKVSDSRRELNLSLRGHNVSPENPDCARAENKIVCSIVALN